MNNKAPLTAEMIRQKAADCGAVLCGIGSLSLFAGEDKQHDPLQILPAARCIIGFGIPVPRALYRAMEEGRQYYNYTSMGVKYIDDEYSEILLFKIGQLIEDAGYDACLQRAVPGLRTKGDHTTNPEVNDTYELVHAVPVAPGKAAPDVMLDFGKAARACGIGMTGKSGHIIHPKYGPFIRYAFVLTDAPLPTDPPFAEDLCRGCHACADACPGHAIAAEGGLDTWQCAVYYKGAHKSNPFLGEDFLQGHPHREEILNGSYRFDAESARALYPSLDFLPKKGGFAPCLCGRPCDVACMKHLTEKEGK